MRAGAILAALVLVVVAVFVLTRSASLPAFLQDYGFHQTGSGHQGNVEEWMGQPLQYLESSYCAACHQASLSRWRESKHSSVGCETCHGPAKAHVEAQASPVVDASREFCALCHATLPSRPGDFPQVDLLEHGGGQPECVTCHDPHDPGITPPALIPHALEGRTDCLLCHDGGSIRPLPSDHVGRGNETCLSCHQPAETLAITPTPTPQATPVPTATPTVAPSPSLPTPSPTPEPSEGPGSVPHPVEGRADCLLCHDSGSIRPFPSDHAGRGNESCLICHRGEP